MGGMRAIAHHAGDATLEDIRALGRDHAAAALADIKRLHRAGKRVDVAATVREARAELAAAGASADELDQWQSAFMEALNVRLAKLAAINGAAANVLERQIAAALAKATPKGRA